MLFKDDTIFYDSTNDYKNLVDIDLDTSNIKKKPVRFFYIFINLRNITSAIYKYTSDLNNFIGISNNTNSFNKDTNITKYNFRNTLSKIMKFSEHLFTYYIKTPPYPGCITIAMLIICIISNYLNISLIYIFFYSKKAY